MHGEISIGVELLKIAKAILIVFMLIQLGITVENADAFEQEGGKRVIIDGMDRYRVIEPMVEGVRIILTHRGEQYSPAYIQGISGIAFRIAGICPCAPTIDPAIVPTLKLLGYEYEHLPLSGDGLDPDKEIHKLVARVKDEIRAGRPVLVWHAFTNAEWDLVYGFDEESKQFLGRGSYAGNDEEYASADETRAAKCGHICDPQGAIIIGEKTGEFDARKADLAALRWAVDHAHSKRGADQLDKDEWVLLEGLMAYDRWINDFKDPEKTRENGDSYCYGIYKSTHRAASEFLKEIAPKYPEIFEHLKMAAEHFKAEADTLDSGADLLWWDAPKGPDAERNLKAVNLLSKARESYASGIMEIEKALSMVDAKGMKKIDNLDFSPRATSHMGALEGCLKYLGIDVSPGWLYGSTGHAFILNIDDDLCGSGPHCWGWGIVNQLGKNIGYKAEAVYTNVNKEDFSQKQEKAWDFARKSIDDGFPCYGWHYDFMVINGYDEGGYLLSGPVDDAPGDWRKFGADAVGFLEIWSIKPGQKADDKTTIKAALSFAADMAKEPDKRTIDPGTGGLSGYDNWIKGLEFGKGDAFGGAYNTSIWAECRRFAVEFLEEANQRTEGEYESLFQQAIEQYKLVSDNLNEVEKLFPYKSATEDEWKQNMADKERRQKAVEHLKAAKDAEAKGLELLAQIEKALTEE